MDSPPAASPREYLKSLRKTARFQPTRRTTPSSAPADAVECSEKSASSPLPPSVAAVSPISPSSSATTITISTPVTPTALATSSPSTSTQTRVRPDSESHTPASALVESFAIDKLIEALEKRRSSFTQQGQYKQAQQAHQRIQLLQTQRELVQAEALRCRHVATLLELDQASVNSLKQFHVLWDEKEKVLRHYINETLQTLQERHAQEREELVTKQNDSISQPHHSKEILTLRLKELEHAKYKNYEQAIHHQEAIQMLEAQELEAHQQKQRLVHQQQLRRLEQKQSAERTSLAQRHQTALAEHFRSRDVELERILARQELLKSQLISAQTKELNNSKSKRSPRLSPPMSTDSPSSPVPMTAATAHIEFVNYIRGSRA